MTSFGGRYELIRRIGSGGMGEVWLAHDERLASRPVAIKIMHKHLLPNADDVARFERETRFAAMMDHPNIVTVYTTGTDDGAPFMVMEYLRGQDLEKAPVDGGAELVAGIGRDICSGLAYAHREGVIHRDIKPANLFLCDTGQVKITDFGVAKAAGGITLSTADVLPGTVAYLPPERWLGEPPTFSNDVWAAGCVLYRLIAGRLPRVLPDAAGYAAAAVRGDPVPDLREVSDAPAWLTDTVTAMLAVDPAARPSAGDCVQLLSAAPATGRCARRRAFSLLPDHGQPGRGRPGEKQPEYEQAGLSLVSGAATEEPAAAAAATQPAVARRAAGRPPGRPRRRPRVMIAAVGGALLVLAGSVTAWQLAGAPKASVLALRGTATSAPPSRAPASRAPASSRPAARSSSAAAPAPPTTAAPLTAPAAGGPAPPTATRPLSPATSRSAPPASTAAASPTGKPTASATPATVALPDVAGMTFASARQLLESDGFTVVGEHLRRGLIVLRTIPAAQAAPGSTVIVIYGRGALIG